MARCYRMVICEAYTLPVAESSCLHRRSGPTVQCQTLMVASRSPIIWFHPNFPTSLPASMFYSNSVSLSLCLSHTHTYTHTTTTTTQKRESKKGSPDIKIVNSGFPGKNISLSYMSRSEGNTFLSICILNQRHTTPPQPYKLAKPHILNSMGSSFVDTF